MTRFEYLTPATVEEALEFIQKYEGAYFYAGGTDILVGVEYKKIQPKYLLDINKLMELQGIKLEGEVLSLGATVKVTEIVESDLIKRHFSLLSQAAAQLGSWQVRNLATLGGNLCNAAPSAELAPPLLALDAVAVIKFADGEKKVPLGNFWVGPGETVLTGKGILKRVEIPMPVPQTRFVYLKHVIRRSMDIALVNMAAAVTVNKDGECLRCRIALGAVAPTPIRALQAEALIEGKKMEQALVEQVATTAAQECKPIDDIRASAWYRREMVKVLVRRGMQEIFGIETLRGGYN